MSSAGEIFEAKVLTGKLPFDRKDISQIFFLYKEYGKYYSFYGKRKVDKSFGISFDMIVLIQILTCKIEICRFQMRKNHHALVQCQPKQPHPVKWEVIVNNIHNLVPVYTWFQKVSNILKVLEVKAPWSKLPVSVIIPTYTHSEIYHPQWFVLNQLINS